MKWRKFGICCHMMPIYLLCVLSFVSCIDMGVRTTRNHRFQAFMHSNTGFSSYFPTISLFFHTISCVLPFLLDFVQVIASK